MVHKNNTTREDIILLLHQTKQIKQDNNEYSHNIDAGIGAYYEGNNLRVNTCKIFSQQYGTFVQAHKVSLDL